MTDKENSISFIFHTYSVYFLYYINANIIILKHYLPYMYCILPIDMTKLFMLCLSGV